jgi:parvulin-like peptidyl-prolyl isomerase
MSVAGRLSVSWLLAAAGTPGAARAGDTMAPTAVVATVNGRAIHGQALQDEEQRFGRLAADGSAASSRARALANLMDRELLVQAAASVRSEVTHADLAAARRELTGQLPSGMRLEQVLARSGLDEADLNWQLRDAAALRKRLEAEWERIDVSTRALKAVFERNPGVFDRPESVTVRHALLPLPRDADPALLATAQARAGRLRDRLAAGESWAAVLAGSELADCAPGAGERYERVPRGAMQADLDAAAFALSAGGMAPPVRTPAGIHLLAVEQRHPAQPATWPADIDRIRGALEAGLRRRVTQQFLANLRRRAQINVLIDLPGRPAGRAEAPPANPAADQGKSSAERGAEAPESAGSDSSWK